MKLGYLPALFFLVFSKLALAGGAHGIDCSKKIPGDLAEMLAASQPELSLPDKRDLDSASIDDDIGAGGDGCYLITKGFFDGGRSEAVAIVFRAKDGRPDLAVASKHDGRWLIHHLPTFCEDIKFCYVKRGGPGTYVRSNALDTPPNRKSELTEIKSEHDVVISGRLESTGITYVNKSGRWLYVWTSD